MTLRRVRLALAGLICSGAVLYLLAPRDDVLDGRWRGEVGAGSVDLLLIQQGPTVHGAGTLRSDARTVPIVVTGYVAGDEVALHLSADDIDVVALTSRDGERLSGAATARDPDMTGPAAFQRTHPTSAFQAWLGGVRFKK